jgi:hypothetical protein
MNGVGRWTLAAIALVAALTACGGGGDDEAGSGALTLSMSAIDLKGGSTSTCYSGFAYRVFVSGGVAPYKVVTDVPDALVFDTSEVGSVGGSFDVSGNGVCFSKGTIIVTDRLNKRVLLPVTNVVGTT